VALIYAPPATGWRKQQGTPPPINASPGFGTPISTGSTVPTIFNVLCSAKKEEKKYIISVEIQFGNKTQTQIEKQNFQCHRTYGGLGFSGGAGGSGGPGGCASCVCAHPVRQKQTRWNTKSHHTWRMIDGYANDIFGVKARLLPDNIYRAVMV